MNGKAGAGNRYFWLLLLILLAGVIPFSYVTFADVEEKTEETMYVKEEIPFHSAVITTDEAQEKNMEVEVFYEGPEKVEPVIDEEGSIKVNYPGTYSIEIKEQGSSRIVKERIVKVIAVPEKTGTFIHFEKDQVLYTPGTNDHVAGNQRGEITVPEDHGEITYILDREDAGLTINENGEVKVSDYGLLQSAMEDDRLEVEVKGVKKQSEWYGEDFDSYRLIIESHPAPEHSFSVSEPEEGRSWYSFTPVITAEKEYQITDTISGNTMSSFSDTLSISGEGQQDREFYLRNRESGELYRPEHRTFLIDKTGPGEEEMKIVTEGIKPVKKEGKTYGFFSDAVTVKLVVMDRHGERMTSPVESIDWVFKTEEGNIYQNGRISDPELNKQGKYEGIVTLPVSQKPVKGRIQFTATDQAGNRSHQKEQNEIIVMDREAPVIDVVLSEGERSDDVSYYKEEVTGKIYILEDNFFTEDCRIYLEEKNKGRVSAENIEWTHQGNLHCGTIRMNREGNFHLIAEYPEDPSGNQGKNLEGEPCSEFTSDRFIIDHTKPLLTADYETPGGKDEKRNLYFRNPIRVKLNVEEENFKKEGLKVRVFSGKKEQAVKKIWTKTERGYCCSFSLGTEEKYRIKAEYRDPAGNFSESVTSPLLILDKRPPVVKTVYKPDKPAKKQKGRLYFNKKQEGEIRITEENFAPENVTVEVTEPSGKRKAEHVRLSSWKKDGKEYVMKAVFPGDENYRVHIECKDRAGNPSEKIRDKEFTVDKTPPAGLKAVYEPGVKEEKKKTYYNRGARVRLYAEDSVSHIDSFHYRIKENKGNKTDVREGTVSQKDITFTKDGKKACGEIYLPDEGQGVFRGNLEFYACDRSGNPSACYRDGKEVIEDSSGPGREITYSMPVKQEKGVSYYDRQAVIHLKIKEENFYDDDPVINITKDGRTFRKKAKWKKTGNNRYETEVILNEEGNYRLDVNYEDKSGNRMKEYQSGLLVVDKTIRNPEILINHKEGNKRSFSGNVKINVKFSDRNPESMKVRLFHQYKEGKKEDVTDKYLKLTGKTDRGESAELSGFRKTRGTDGIYELKTEFTDKAGHKTRKAVSFTINRFGSEYMTGESLTRLLSGKGYVQKVRENLVIEEINPDSIEENQREVIITCDGKPVKPVKFTVTEKKNKNGDSWHKYRCSLNKENFAKEGIYKLSVLSKDRSGNTSQTEEELSFTVDRTPPEITLVRGLEEKTVNRRKLKAEYLLYDTSGIERAEIYLNGEKINTELEKQEDGNNYAGDFVIRESFRKQKIRIVVEDFAGNITDTDSSDFTCSYPFNREVVVSTNPLIRTLAEYFSFILSGMILLVVLFIFIIRKTKK